MLLIFLTLAALIGLENIILFIAGIDYIDPVTFAMPVIALHSVVTLCYCVTRGTRTIGAILCVGFILRLGLMFCDFYHLFPILNSGADTEAYDFYANVYFFYPGKEKGYNYPEFLYYIYCATFKSRMIAQYINVLFGTGILVMVWKMLDMLRIRFKARKITLLILALLPNLIIFSGILLREAFVEFFTCVSAFYFVRWFVRGGWPNILGCIATLLLASMFHAGVIGIAIGYTVAFLTYNPSTGKVTFSTSSVISLVILTAVYLLIADSMDIFTQKFNDFSFEDNKDFMGKVNRVGGGNSDYLTWISADSTAQGLIFSPLKMLYFLFSPLPTEWRRVSDVIGFAIDGALYMWMCWTIYKYRPGSHLVLKRFLVLAFLCASFIFGYGTFNAGTAFRHRAKIVSLIAVACAISYRPREKSYTQKDIPVNHPFAQ